MYDVCFALTSVHHDWIQLPSLVETNSGRSSYSFHQPSLLAWLVKKMQRAQGVGVNCEAHRFWDSDALRLYIVPTGPSPSLTNSVGLEVPTTVTLTCSRTVTLTMATAGDGRQTSIKWNVYKYITGMKCLHYSHYITTLHSTSAKMSPTHDIVLPRNLRCHTLKTRKGGGGAGDCITRVEFTDTHTLNQRTPCGCKAMHVCCRTSILHKYLYQVPCEIFENV